MGSNPSLSRHPYAPSFHEWGEKNALALLGNFDTSSFRAPPFLFSSQIPVEIAGDVIPELIAIPRVDFIAVAPVAQKFSDGTRRAAVSVAILTSEQNIGILNHQILACLQ